MLPLLVNAKRTQKLAHAYLFTGQPTETLEEALQLAMAANCLSPDTEPFCGECLSCRKIRHGNHPDVLLVTPQGLTLKIGQTREIQKAMGFKRFEGQYKVVIMAGAELMSIAAGNSLLKILEEPPANTIFILTAENVDGILPTIQSRCQLLQVPEGTPADQGADGIQEKMEKAHTILEQLPQMDANQLLQLAGELDKNKEEIPAVLEIFLTTLRDLAVCRLTGMQSLACLPQWLERAERLAISPEKCLQAAGLVQNSLRQLEQKANTHLVLDVLLIRLHQLMRTGQQDAGQYPE